MALRDNLFTIGDYLYWSYSNLSMAHIAVKDGDLKYGSKHYAIRAKMFKGFQQGEMNVKSFFDDERLKMTLPQVCSYCGSPDNLTLDHLIPKNKGGQDIGENFVWACRTCNSSKSDIDLLEWASNKGVRLSILVLRRYLKNVISFVKSEHLLNSSFEERAELNLPFNLDYLPLSPINLEGLKLWVTEDNKKLYRIANWNLERPKKGTRKTKLAINKIQEIGAELIVLTETSTAIDLSSSYNSIKSIPLDKTPDEHWVTIWSKWNVIKEIVTFAPNRTVCGLIDSPFGEIIIYGTIIPYHMAGVQGNRYFESGYKTWELHEKDIINQSKDWQKIRLMYPNSHFLVVGDFNQTRDDIPKGYGTTKVRQLLSNELSKSDLECITGVDFSKNGKLSIDPKRGKVRRNIDHICVSKHLLQKVSSFEVGAWDHFTHNGLYMSDHNGVYFDFKI